MNKAELVAQQLLEGNLNKVQWGSAMYNVLVEGLAGGGVVDDTAKLQVLVDKAIAEGRKAIFFPHGTNGQYRVTALTNADQVVFFGDNASFVGGYTGEILQLGEGGVTQAEFDALEAETATQLAQIANKADITYVNSQIATVASGSPKGVYATLAALQAAIPAGNTNIYLVTADGKWYYWNGSAWTAGGVYQGTGIADGSVTPSKLSFIPLVGVAGKNLFNKDTVVNGFYASYINGTLQALSTTSASDYIPVTANAKYVLSGTSEQLAFYDSSKVFVSGVATPGNIVLTAPATAAFVRLSMLTTAVNNVQFEAGSIVTTYESYGYRLNNVQISNSNINFIKNTPVSQTKLTVKKDGTGNFTDVRAANESITDSSSSKPYLIEVHDGIYDYDTSTMDWHVKPYTTIRGVSKERVHLKGQQPDNASLTDIENKSTLFLDSTSNLENLTVTVKNGRYPIHCEAAGLNPNAEHNLKNCHIEHLGNQGARKWQQDNGGDPNAVWQSETCWGYGSASGIVERFRDVTFLGNSYSFYVHNNKNFVTACEQYLDNCRIGKKRVIGAGGETIKEGTAIRVECLGSLRNDKVYINNSEITGNISMGDSPWIPTDDKSQLARHAEIDLIISDSDAIPFTETCRSRALRIKGDSNTVLSLSGSALAVLFGQPAYFNGKSGLSASVYGNLDISGIKTSLASNVDSKNTLGQRLGDCSSVSKQLVVTKDGVNRTITFNLNYTTLTNADILTTMNTALSGFAVAEEMKYDFETYYPQFVSAQKNLQNTSAVGIERGSIVSYSSEYGIKKMSSTDNASLFAGIAIDPVNPNDYGRVLTKGRIHRNYLIDLPVGLVFGDTLIIGADGKFVKGVGEVVGKAINNDIIQFG